MQWPGAGSISVRPTIRRGDATTFCLLGIDVSMTTTHRSRGPGCARRPDIAPQSPFPLRHSHRPGNPASGQRESEAVKTFFTGSSWSRMRLLCRLMTSSRLSLTRAHLLRVTSERTKLLIKPAGEHQERYRGRGDQSFTPRPRHATLRESPRFRSLSEAQDRSTLGPLRPFALWHRFRNFRIVLPL